MCTVVISLLPLYSSGFGTSQPSHVFTPGTQSQVSVDSRSFSYSESGLGEKYADDDDGCDARESERGGLGRSPNVSRLALMGFWSERHVRDAWPPDACLDALGSLEAWSHDGEAGSISWKGCFILRTERKGEMQAGLRSAGRFGCCDVVYSDCSGRGLGTNERPLCECCRLHGLGFGEYRGAKGLSLRLLSLGPIWFSSVM